MDQQLAAVGERVRARMPEGLSQRKLATAVGMPPDALSRALNGQRGFSSIELARLAEALGVGLQWLITGQEDPLRADVAARHAWDALRAERLNPGREADDEIIEKVIAVYHEAYPDGPPRSQELPSEPDMLRGQLGDGFARRIAELVETTFAIDVIRVPELSTDYSLRIGDRSVVLLVSTASWFRNNWSVAHELGHLALGHHAGDAVEVENERPANDFAAELLLPEAWMRRIKWARLDERGLAEIIWETGVSVEAMRNRLRELHIRAGAVVDAALKQSTQRLLRPHAKLIADSDTDVDPIVERETESTGRRFPLHMLSDLSQRVGAGLADPYVLAWAMGVPVDEIDFPEPDDDLASAEYEQLLAARPSAVDWAERLAAERGQTAS